MSSLWIRAKRMATNTLSAATYSSPRTAAKSYRVRLNDSPIACTAVQLWLHARTGIALAVERANDQTRKPRERAPTVFEFSHCLMDFTVQWLRNTHVNSARSPINSCRGISSAHSFRRSISNGTLGPIRQQSDQKERKPSKNSKNYGPVSDRLFI